MNQLPRKFGFLVAIFFALIAAPLVAQNGAGWKASSGGNGSLRRGRQIGQVAELAAAAPKGISRRAKLRRCKARQRLSDCRAGDHASASHQGQRRVAAGSRGRFGASTIFGLIRSG